MLSSKARINSHRFFKSKMFPRFDVFKEIKNHGSMSVLKIRKSTKIDKVT